METPQQTLARIQDQRKYQPSAIGNSLFMLLVRYTSLAGFFILAGISVYAKGYKIHYQLKQNG